MSERDLLMVPGPTNVSPSVLRAAFSKPTVSHVSETFANLMKDTLADLRQIFKTTGVILPIAGSGTLGSEVALANVVEPGDRILAVCSGFFADRLADVAGTLGAHVDRLDVAWGSVADPDVVERKLSSASYKALLVVDIDTSTGAENPVDEKLGAVAKAHNLLYVVDAVCSLGGVDLQVNSWGIDVCFARVTKGTCRSAWLAIISFSSNAMKVREQRKSPISTYYGDVKRWAPVMEDPTKYFATHPVNMIYALHESCKMILSEGLNARFDRHAKLATAFHTGMRSIDLRLLCEENVSANTLTVSYYPKGVNDMEFRKTMASDYGVVVAGGLGPLSQKVFRVGHFGNVVVATTYPATIAAVEGSLAAQGYDLSAGAGVAAANRELD